MDEAECRARLSSARVGRLATVRPDGGPHVVACCFAVQGDRLWTAIDAKPKATTRLQRLDNIRAHPRASLLVDHYEEDWDELWWVRADGSAAVVEAGVEHDAAVGALVAKYLQYEVAPPRGAVIAVVVERWVGWSAAAV
jgi:PPOX class probable F420-dependent enzyme